MQIGIDSFAGADLSDDQYTADKNVRSLANLLDQIVLADEVGLDVFGIGEHYRREFLDSAPTLILAAAAARTKQIRLTSAVTVLSAADPVRVFQEFATLDLISNGRAEIIAGRGSFSESFPLFGLNFDDYDSLFAEKLDMLLHLREEEVMTWSGRFRAPLEDQPIYPRPKQALLPVWLGVGGTPSSFVRAGRWGLPLMVAIIGGETHRFRPLVDSYREAWLEAGHPEEAMRVGIHSLGYVAETDEAAVADYYPGYAEVFTKIGQERGWPPVTRASFEAQNGPTGALLVGSPKTIVEKIKHHSEALGGIDRLTFQMVNAGLPHEKVMNAIKLIGNWVSPSLLASVNPETIRASHN